MRVLVCVGVNSGVSWWLVPEGKAGGEDRDVNLYGIYGEHTTEIHGEQAVGNKMYSDGFEVPEYGETYEVAVAVNTDPMHRGHTRLRTGMMGLASSSKEKRSPSTHEARRSYAPNPTRSTRVAPQSGGSLDRKSRY